MSGTICATGTVPVTLPYVDPFDLQRLLKNDTNMDSLIPPFLKNPPPDFLGLSGQ